MAYDLPSGGFEKRSDLDGTSKLKSDCYSHLEQLHSVRKKSSMVSLTASPFLNTVFMMLIRLR